MQICEVTIGEIVEMGSCSPEMASSQSLNEDLAMGEEVRGMQQKEFGEKANAENSFILLGIH